MRRWMGFSRNFHGRSHFRQARSLHFRISSETVYRKRFMGQGCLHWQIRDREVQLNVLPHIPVGEVSSAAEKSCKAAALLAFIFQNITSQRSCHSVDDNWRNHSYNSVVWNKRPMVRLAFPGSHLTFRQSSKEASFQEGCAELSQTPTICV